MGRNLVIWVVIALVLVALFQQFQGGSDSRAASEPLKYSTFKEEVRSDRVRDVVIGEGVLAGKYRSGEGFTVKIGTSLDPELIKLLDEHRVGYEFEAEETSVFWSILISWFPMLLLIGVWIFIMRQMQSGTGKAMGFGKSKARLLNENAERITFEDVAGIEEAKEEVEEIVEFLKNPEKFQRLGGRIPRGALLVGPPGTGKTLLARAIAGEANVPFFTISGSDFVEMFVGVGASRVRDMFEQAKKTAPCIVFIDEIDAVGRHRGAGLGGGNDEREQTLNQLLVEMDGFEENQGVIIVAATNRPDVLDPALLRPGRFDRQIVVPNPDMIGREKILKVHMRRVPLAPDVITKTIARGTPGFSGADLANLVNEAALLAARRGRKVVAMAEFEDAKDKVMMGPERRSMVMSEDEKKLTAYHEGGHALVAIRCKSTDPIHKATIIPRGRSLGMVLRLPESDQLSMSREKAHDELAVLMGGRIAEELTFGYEKVTTGASSDIKQATAMARSMVTEWGMSDELGPLTYCDNQEEIFLGHSVTRNQTVSEETANKIDAEVRRMIDDAYVRATKILTDGIDDLETIAQGLIEYETLSGDEINALLRGEELLRGDGEEETSAGIGKPQTVPSSGKVRGAGLGSTPEPQPGT